ncbi:adenosylcobinamide-phosphate synthase CbiB [Niveibacterium microcysteis]|uniref:Cobalamin biosynthesis protein CobD n=1 Tax=Niveibacterium microcysteis TaxID=2811415 RepID=A0ABX7M5M1_9RHOO|nr:adenosylcobinamide-phosphate synthase CbiB [Niveibacterium microcysteis]QSI77052.1 cobalamin biosynthesis protein [Niveibacterium microcysteis]
MSTLASVVLALALDALLGEPRRWHPLVGFGRLAQALEARCNRHGNRLGRVTGLLCWAALVLPPVALCALALPAPADTLFGALVLYFALGARSLAEHARAVAEPLLRGELPAARQALSMIVSRDTTALSESGVAAATCESVLENGNDAVFGALFWFVVAGAPGALLFRLANTLDAMWGYRTPRLLHFGWAAARLDDLLNLIPARLTALSYALAGSCANALHCWHTQAARHDSPNAGPVMAAGAGALGLALGGPAVYHGKLEQRPTLGRGRDATPADIDAALRLTRRALLLWLAAITLGGLIATRIGT